MPSVNKSVELGLDQQQGFALATDPARFEEWLTLHQAWPNGAPASTDTGQEFVQKLSIMGMPADVNWRVEEHEAGSKLVLKGSGPMGANLSTTITASPSDAGCELSYLAEFDGGGLQGPMGEIVTQKAGEEIETSLGRLKALAG